MTIEIGNKNLSELNAENLLDIAKIEGVHLFFEYWGEVELEDFSNTLFSDTLVVDFFQKRLEDGFIGKTIVFFFDFKKCCFHWHFKGEEGRTRESKRIKLDVIKYLIQKGFNIPIY